tara:strand:- start:7700 stop:7909 length:210 start_codon:yes stop_codon:yes gene_type:complete
MKPLSKLFAVDKQGLVIRGTQNRMRVTGFATASGYLIAHTSKGSRVISSLTSLLFESGRRSGKWKGGAK